MGKQRICFISFFVVSVLVFSDLGLDGFGSAWIWGCMDLGLYGYEPNVRADMSAKPWNVTAVIARRCI